MNRSVRPLLPIIAGVAMLAGCASSPPARFYTLLPQAQSPTQSVASPAFALEIMLVTLPVQVDQPQIMLRTTGDALAPMYSERWASPLGEELQAAISQAMTSALGAPDVRALGAPPGIPVWRVQVDVQRFDMILDGPALIDATWRIRQTKDEGIALLCRSEIRVQPQAQDVPSLVQAQQEAVGDLAATMAGAIENGGRAPQGTHTVQMRGCSSAAQG